MTARRLDLDELRTSRKIAEREAPEVVFGGETFVLPIEMPFSVVEAHARADDGDAFYRAIKDLLGDEKSYQRFLALKPSEDDMGAFVSGVPVLYMGGADPEASGASDDSLSTSARSKPTSNGSTGSTSEHVASESSP